MNITFDDVVLKPQYSTVRSRKDVSIISFLSGRNLFDIWLDVPIISSNMDTITGSKMAIAMRDLGGIGCLHRYNSIKENVEEFIKLEGKQVICSIGGNDLERFRALKNVGADKFCVDMAHGHSIVMKETLEAIRKEDPVSYILAGNIATKEAAIDLKRWGADGAKVGVGPGSVCTTRVKTGVGCPQLTAISDVSSIIDCVADGGIRTPGDVAKALAFGAKAVMLGGMLAGTDETPGESILGLTEGWDLPIGWQGTEIPKKHFKCFRGMASQDAHEDLYGSMPEYKTAEGIKTTVGCKGPVANVIKDIVGGLRSSLSYCGAHTLQEFRDKMEYMQVSQAGYKEGTAHFNG